MVSGAGKGLLHRRSIGPTIFSLPAAQLTGSIRNRDLTLAPRGASYAPRPTCQPASGFIETPAAGGRIGGSTAAKLSASVSLSSPHSSGANACSGSARSIIIIRKSGAREEE